MDGNYSVAGLQIEDRPGAAELGRYQLTLDGTLSINSSYGASNVDAGDGPNPGRIVSGMTPGRITFNHVETGEFTWTSGVIAVTVEVTIATKFRIEAGGARKTLAGSLQIKTLDAAWDGVDEILLTGPSPAIHVFPGGKFRVERYEGDAKISALDNAILNEGHFEVFIANKGVFWLDRGIFVNNGELRVLMGDMIAVDLINLNTIDIGVDGILVVGNRPGTTPSGYLTLGASGSSSTKIIGAGMLYIRGKGLKVEGPHNTVTEVTDVGERVQGAGSLYIAKQYYWGLPGNTPSFWSGGGLVQVGSPESPNAVLTLAAGGQFSLKRAIVNHGKIQWYNAAGLAAGGGWLEFHINTDGSLVNAPSGIIDIIVAVNVSAKITRAAGVADIVNGGLLRTEARNNRMIEIEPKYVEMVVPLFGVTAKVENIKGVLILNGLPRFAFGKLLNHLDGVVLMEEGVEHFGGEIVNHGTMMVQNGHFMTGGTLTNSGTFGQMAQYTADDLTKSGGTTTNTGLFTVTDDLVLSGTGTFNNNLSTMSPPQVLVQDVFAQSGGTFNNNAKVTVQQQFNLSGGSFLIPGSGMGGKRLDAQAMTQSGGYYSITGNDAKMHVVNKYLFSGGTSIVNPAPGYMPGHESEFGDLEVTGFGITLSGRSKANSGIDVQAGGGLQLTSNAVVTANVVIDQGGRIDAATLARVVGSLTNSGILHIGWHGVSTGNEPFYITGNFTQSGTGNLHLDASGTPNLLGDMLHVSGHAALNGGLSVNATDWTGFTITALGSYGSYSGGFSGWTLTGANAPTVTIWYGDPWANQFGIKV